MQKLPRFPRVRSLMAATTVLVMSLFAGCASISPTTPSAGISQETQEAAAAPVDPAGTTPTAEFSGSPGDERTPKVDDLGQAAQTNLWDRIRLGFAMPELDSPLVAEKEQFYLARPDYLQRMFERSGRYLFYIVEEIEKRGMPTELALLPFVESAMNPSALSSAQAAGLWQFIPSTGKAYDLHQNWWVDNRRDVVKSTQAALDYLQKIYEMQGNDWFLALASYNWGEGAVSRAMKRNKARGKPADYLSLKMPAETRHYVPKLMALKQIVLNADRLGVALPFVPNRPYFVTIEKTRPIDLTLAAQFAGMSVDEFVALNPAHNRPVIAASVHNEIRLPADRIDDFMRAVEQHEEAKKVFATWQPYTLKPGESIDSIARDNGVSAEEIRKANGIRANQMILAGSRLLAPHKEVTDESQVEQFVAPRVYERVERPAQYHRVGRKDTLNSIARRYRVSTKTLTAWNNLKNGIRRGMRLLVRPASTQTLLTREDGNRAVISVKSSSRQPNSRTARRSSGKAKSSTRRARTNQAASSRASRVANRNSADKPSVRPASQSPASPQPASKRPPPRT